MSIAKAGPLSSQLFISVEGLGLWSNATGVWSLLHASMANQDGNRVAPPRLLLLDAYPEHNLWLEQARTQEAEFVIR